MAGDVRLADMPTSIHTSTAWRDMRTSCLLICLLLTGCANFYPQTQIGMVHDYVIDEATRLCGDHRGVHYIVAIKTLYGKSSNRTEYGDDYPCTDAYRVRCQDGKLRYFDSGAAYCFIDQDQLQKTLDDIDLENSGEYK